MLENIKAFYSVFAYFFPGFFDHSLGYKNVAVDRKNRQKIEIEKIEMKVSIFFVKGFCTIL